MGCWFSENMLEGFKSDCFCFLVCIIIVFEEVFVEGSDGEICIKFNLYILVWEFLFFEELLM